MSHFWSDLKAAGLLWYEKDADYMAATASYYALFAVAPMLVLSIAYLSILYGHELVTATLLKWGNILGPDMLRLLGSAIDNLETLSASVKIPVLGLFFFSGMIVILFNTLTSGLHHLWDIPHRGVRGWIKKSLNSVVFMFVFEIYLVGVIAFQLLTEWFYADAGFVGWSVNTTFFLIVTTIFFSLAYRILPWQAPPLKNRLYAAFIASILMVGVKTTVASYLLFTPVPGLYDAAGVMLSLLLWLYATACVFYFGGALAKVSV